MAVSAMTGPVSSLTVAAVAGWLALGPGAQRASFDPDHFPVAALATVAPGEMPPELFNRMRWGGYLLYAYPEIRIFIDGHADLFGESLAREYLAIYHLRPEWQDNLHKYNVSWTLTTPDAPITQALDISRAWRRYYADDVAVIFYRVGAEPTSWKTNESAHVKGTNDMFQRRGRGGAP